MILISSFILIACNHIEKIAAPAFDISTVKNHINEMNKSYGDRFIRNDTSFYYSRYCKDAIAMPEHQNAIIGRDSIMRYNYKNGANKDIKILITAENIYGTAELVVEEGSYRFPDGKGGSFNIGKFIALWKQESGSWKLYREIWNSNNPPAAN